ncbi:hypothetical protein ACFS6H_16450 [Terrimonas rubra]|uniref:Uncharacterized protein n=1 Tax=Terrimonas rubra TaxID=1035890 RepID=A0ABW6A7H4_9BACT
MAWLLKRKTTKQYLFLYREYGSCISLAFSDKTFHSIQFPTRYRAQSFKQKHKLWELQISQVSDSDIYIQKRIEDFHSGQ